MGRVEIENQSPSLAPPPPHPQTQQHYPQPPPLPPPQFQAQTVNHIQQQIQPPPLQFSYNQPRYGRQSQGRAFVGVQNPMVASRVNGVNLRKGVAPWTTGIFDCMQDPTNAFITTIFPCVTFGQIAEILDNGNTRCTTSGILYAFAPCPMSRPYRRKLRQRFGLMEAPASDGIMHFLLEPCSLCQEYRELHNRGINPALGYHGNRNQQRQAGMKPTPPPMIPPQNQMMQ